ncbi:MAG: hypothetical protein JO222_03575 [Frankiales bacterium]|nr:hypothetical protein [Frankiales bacterium]
MTAVRRRAIALLVIATGGVGALLLGAAAPAGAQAPAVASWWNVANLGKPAPAPPAPPDVKAGDLLVQGSNSAPAGVTLPVSKAPASAQAIAGLSFTLAATDIVGALRLTIEGTPPPQVSVVACKATKPVPREENGPWADVPAYDGTACDPGVLKGSTVVFANASRLVTPGRLALVLLPGPVDRVVFKHPDASALQVTSATGVGAAAPPLGSDNGTGTTPSGGNAGPVSAPVGGSAVSQPTVGLPPPSTSTAPATPPLVAGQPTTPGTTTPAAAARTTAASSGLSTGARRAIALVILALEAVGFVLMSRTGEPPAVVTGAGLVAGAAGAGGLVGGRFRPPDRVVAGGRSVATADVGGVGRFRRERSGPAPQL